jgi:hypothetical protein
MELGYMSFLEIENYPNATDIFTRLVGAEPFGSGLKTWIDRAPGFTMDRVSTPQLVMHFGQHLLPWEEFVASRHLRRPAEFVLFPDAEHNPVRPTERLAVKQQTVDWFRFWLQDYEDPNPTKAAQYARWHRLREQRDALRVETTKQPTAPASTTVQ